MSRFGGFAIRSIFLWCWRLCVYASLALVVLVGAAILGLRYYILPNIDAYRGDLERTLTRAIGQRIAIGDISAEWQGLRPQFSFDNVVVYDNSGRPALALGRIDNSLSWLSLLVLEPRFESVRMYEPHLEVRRAADGTLWIAGIAWKDSTEGGSLADWVFRQRSISITDASIVWTDEQRRAPALALKNVRLTLENEYFRHRFALTANTPPELAGAIDVRGDLVGRSVSNFGEWQGQIFTQLDYIDLAAWKPWIDVPIEIAHGRGGLRAWTDVAQQRVTAVTADLQLSDLKARLEPGLQALDLTSLSGRVAWRGWSKGFEISARNLKGVAVAGHSFETDTFSVRRMYAQRNTPSRTEINATSLDLDALAHLVEHLPIDAALREELGRYAPRGKLYDFSGKWTGVWAAGPYELKSRFENLAFNPVDYLPGWRGITGSVEANDKGGSLTLANHALSVELPKVFAEPLAFEQASGHIKWAAAGREIDFRLADFKFANADLAGSVNGSYRSIPGESGSIDLTGALSRADASRVARYLPFVVSKAVRDWVQTSVLAGRSDDVKVRLKGRLADFPFGETSKGIFQVTAKARDGVLEYASGWPRIENITADLAFTGTRMEIRAPSARIFGAQLSRVQASIRDLAAANEILEVSGEAEGPTAEFTRFMAQSPVGSMVEHSAENLEPQGNGRLSLRFTMPLGQINETRIAGSYTMQGNRLRVHPDLPPFEQVTGRIDFTESAAKAQGISGQILGGPVLVNLSSQEGGLAVTASGRASMDALRRVIDAPLLKELTGSADWRASARMRGKDTEFTLDSDLRGIGSSLPAPLAKSPVDALPLRVARRPVAPDRDQIDIALGAVLNARFLRRRDGPQFVFDRGAVGLGVEMPSTDGPGLAVRGALAVLDLDRWRALSSSDTVGGMAPPVMTMELKLGALDVLGRRFNDVSINAREKSSNWQARVSARELLGDIDWRSQGKGQLTARLQRLSLPSVQGRVGTAAPETQPQRTEYPALDVVVDDFQHNGRALGRLHVQAVPQGRNWQIDQLQLVNPDGTLNADGSWQWQAQVPETRMNFKLEVSDIGKFLGRMGYPEGVRGGTANLYGRLSWNGAPQDMDIPSLTGQMTVEAARGQFAKLEPGIGKLLSILSLQALPRRVALDFKDVFSEGFSFDAIAGTVKVQSGIANTQNFQISGSSAKVAMNGEVDLARETQTLRVRVVPSIGDSVSTVAALLGGPVAGIGVFLAQRLLNDPLGQLIAYNYSVTGTWADPAVVKLGVDRAEPS